jgi:MtN3 and saliva related transmembrane protein
MSVAAVGLVAGALTTSAWLPQLHRTWRSRSAHDLSWGYLLTTCTGIALWLTYGVVTRDVAIIVANAITIVLLSGQVALKTLGSRAPLRADAVELGEVLVGQAD